MDQPIQRNAKRLLLGGFMAILAAGVGFGVRGALFDVWGAQFHFNGAQLGAISLGAGFVSFCFGIIIGGLLVDKIGYGKLVVAAFLLHIISAFVTLAAKEGMSTDTAFVYLYWGTFLFGLANGTLEAVANPLVATLFPQDRTHYLNILHASWPLGMVIGGLIAYFGGMQNWTWQMQLGLYLIPTALYGILFFAQKFPKSEASTKGLSLGEMFKPVGILGTAIVSSFLFLFLRDSFIPLLDQSAGTHLTSQAPLIAGIIAGALLLWVAVITKFAIGHWLLVFLFIIHACIGSVELGTDGWIQNITGTLLTEDQGRILFIITSLAMFLLRFCAHTIETKLGLKPIGLLLVCSMVACLGLNLVASIHSFGPAIGAVLVYALGKTFFWPTMLAVVGDRFPQTGAVAMSLMGGVGMMSVGIFGGPGLGYLRDHYSSKELQAAAPDIHKEWVNTDNPTKFFNFPAVNPIDPARLKDAKAKAAAAKEVAAGTADKDKAALAATFSDAEKTVVDADIRGNRSVLRTDSLIPVAMAVAYLLLLIYFKAIGGYRPLHINSKDDPSAS